MCVISIQDFVQNKYNTYILKIAMVDGLKCRKQDRSDTFTYILFFYWVVKPIENLEGN